MNLVFCVTSALGQDADGGQLQESALRFRVFDPFFWALTLDMSAISRTLCLVVDGLQQDPYNTGRLIWDELSNHGEVATYYLGQSRPAGSVGQQLPDEPPRRTRQPLIGPILEQLPSDTIVLVVTGSTIIDLNDFQYTVWRERLLLVATDESMLQGWSHAFTYSETMDAKMMVDNLLQMEKELRS